MKATPWSFFKYLSVFCHTHSTFCFYCHFACFFLHVLHMSSCTTILHTPHKTLKILIGDTFRFWMISFCIFVCSCNFSFWLRCSWLFTQKQGPNTLNQWAQNQCWSIHDFTELNGTMTGSCVKACRSSRIIENDIRYNQKRPI